MDFEFASKRWVRNDCCPSCLYSLVSNKCVGYLHKRPHHLTSYWYTHYKKHLPVHRILWILDSKLDFPVGFEIDHIDRSGMNNSRCNLRILSSTDQKFNVSARRNSTSNYKGVSWAKQKLKWRAQIQIDRKKIFLGYFDTEIEAALAYDKYAEEHAPRSAYLNFK